MSTEFALKYLREQGFELPGDAVSAHRWCLELAERGVVEAQCVASTLYWTGLTGHQDASIAFEWCEKAALAGSQDALCILAGHLLSGTKAQREPERAVRILKDLANAGHVPAMLSLALLMLSGVSDLVPRDTAFATELLLEPANAGNPTAQCLLGTELMQSHEPSVRRAGVQWIARAAENGSATAHRYLSTFYRSGEHGFTVDADKARIHEQLAEKYEANPYAAP
jgi:hypothetical protein